jgi:hypothetical protein
MENPEKVETPDKPEKTPEPPYCIGQVRVLAETEKAIGIAHDPPTFDDKGREEAAWFPKSHIHITSDVISKDECEGNFIVYEWSARSKGFIK